MDIRRVTSSTFRAAMGLLEHIAEHTPVGAMTSPLHLPDLAFGGSFDDAACAFYGIAASEKSPEDSSDVPAPSPYTPETAKERRYASAVPFIASFEHLSELTATCVEHSSEEGIGAKLTDATNTQTDAQLHHTFVQGVSLLLKLTTALDAISHTSGALPLNISWDAEQWFDCISRPLSLPVNIFCIDCRLDLTYASHRAALSKGLIELSRSQFAYMQHRLFNLHLQLTTVLDCLP